MSQNEKNDSLSKTADAAFQQAAKKVVERAKRTGTPVVVWEKGHVREVSTEQLEMTAAQKTDNHE